MTDIKISLSCGGFTGLLTILFVALKLFDQIDWSWWWVLSPLWISVVLWIIILLIILFVVWVVD